MSDLMPTSFDEVEPEPGLRERKKRATRHRLHRAALSLALEHGLAGLTTDAVARAAGVSPRTFFNYFATKESALSGITPDTMARLGHFVAERPADESLWETARLVATRLVEGSVRDPDGWRDRRRLLLAQPEAAVAVVGAEHALTTSLLEALTARGEAQPLSRPAWAAPMMGLAVLDAVRVATQLADEPGEVARLVDEVLDRLAEVYA